MSREGDFSSLPFMGRDRRRSPQSGAVWDDHQRRDRGETSPPWTLRVPSLPKKGREEIAVCLIALLLALPASAETLQDALTAAYRGNPVLLGQREQQKALDETFVQAKAGWRPTAGVTLGAQYQRGPNDIADFSQGFSGENSGSATLSVIQPLYTGGRTTWAVRAAKAGVMAGREDLRGVEAQVLASVIQGYVDVLRDQQVLEVRKADMATLERQVAESTAKFNLGQVTRTDVAQAQAQLEAARASLAAADGQLQISRAEYQQAVGEPPADLVEPTDLPGLPATLAEAQDLAVASNPQLRQSRLTEQSSWADVEAAKAAYRPTVALQGSYGFIGPVSPLAPNLYGEEAVAAVTITVPFLTAGMTASQVRQTTAQNNGDRIAIETVRRQVVMTVAQAWSQLLTGRAGVSAGEAQVRAAELALRGAQAEYGYALRTTLDVLISDENLRAAQLSLAGAKHDAYLAQAAVLQASGRLEVSNLLPAEPAYDPDTSFQRVKNASRPPWEGVVESLDKIGAPSGPDR